MVSLAPEPLRQTIAASARFDVGLFSLSFTRGSFWGSLMAAALPLVAAPSIRRTSSAARLMALVGGREPGAGRSLRQPRGYWPETTLSEPGRRCTAGVDPRLCTRSFGWFS